jgi:hypothetical protein
MIRLALMVLLPACQELVPATIPYDLQKASPSIAASKKSGVFRHLLRVNKSIVSMGDNGIDTVREIWAEDQWTEGDKGGIVRGSVPQIVVLFGHTSRRYEGIFLKNGRKIPFAWSGVFFSAYRPPSDTLYLINMNLGSEILTDSLVVTTP